MLDVATAEKKLTSGALLNLVRVVLFSWGGPGGPGDIAVLFYGDRTGMLLLVTQSGGLDAYGTKLSSLCMPCYLFLFC